MTIFQRASFAVIIMSIMNGACGPKKGEVDPNATKALAGDLDPPTCDEKGVKLRYPKHFSTAAALTQGDPRAQDTPREPGTESRDDIETEDVSYEYTRHELSKGTGGGHALITFGDDFKMVLAYLEETIEDGVPVPARMYVRTDKIDVGNCEDPAVYVSKLTYLQAFSESHVQRGTFVLRQAHRDPYCVGTALEGTLSGCFRSE